MGNSILYNTAGSIALAINFVIQGPYANKFLSKEAATTVRVNAEFFVRVGDTVICIETDVDLTAADLDAGAAFDASDTYYIYACQPLDGTLEPDFKISKNATFPAGGWDADNSREIGGFDTDGAAEVDEATLWDLETVSRGSAASTDHDATHARGGTDEIDGDHLDIDFTPTNYSPDTTPAEAANVDDLAAHLKGIDNAIRASVYGVAWDESADTYVRTGVLAAVACGSSPGDAYLPIQRQMRRCVLSDAGVVQYYLDPADSTKKASGDAATIDGTDGQVMVEIPKFYFKYGYSGTVHTWEISNVLLPGFSVHPAFVRSGVEVDHRYCGAYEGFKDGANVLSSESGRTPTGTLTRANFRAYAAARGAGWSQLDFYLVSAVQLLYLTEYADFDSQSMIGTGNTAYAAWNATECIGTTGYSNSDGNGTNASNTAVSTLPVDGSATNDGVEETEYMTYRGIENFYGSMYQFVDGVNINDYVWYACQDPADFADDTAVGYTDLGITAHNSDGYVATLEQIDDGFIAASVGATSATKLCDYYYRAVGWRVCRVGGGAYNGLIAGAFCVNAYSDSAASDASIGGRLCF